MILYIAEKPSLGRAIADALPKPHKKQSGYIEVGNGDVVSWCIGHLLILLGIKSCQLSMILV